jgi:hypothetical protein
MPTAREFADANVPSLEAKRRWLNGVELFRQFSEFVRGDGTVAFNIRLAALSDFLQRDIYFNVYKLAEDLRGVSGRDLDTILTELLGPFLPARVGFDSQFDDGRRVYYAIWHTGGPGLHQFGDFCVRLHRSAGCLEGGSCVPGDSLKRYFGDGLVRRQDLLRDIAPLDFVDVVAVDLASTIIPDSPRERWWNVVCGSQHYVEVILSVAPSVGAIADISIEPGRQRLIADLAIGDFSRRLSDFERSIAADYRNVLRSCHENGIRLETCNL